MKEKRLLIVLFAALLVFSLFGCGKKEDAPAADLADPVSDEDTIDKLSSQTPDTAKEVITITNEMLAKRYETGWEFAQTGRGDLSDKEWLERESYNLGLYGIDPDSGEAMDVCGYATTITWVLMDIGKTVSNSDELKLPDDGLEKFIEWRKEFIGTPGGTNSSNTSNGGSSVSDSTSNKPSGGSSNQGTTNPGGSSGNNSSNSGSNSGSGSSGSSGSGGDPEPWYPEGSDDIPLNVTRPGEGTYGTSNPGEDGYGYGFKP